jgi:uncharacterized membrane protein
MTSPEVFWPYFALCVFLIAAIVAAGREFARARGLDKAEPLGRVTLAIPIATFGAEHFASAHGIMNGVPAWMPWRLFWTYFVGTALIAAAVSLIFRVKVRLSATLLGIMLFCFVAMIHVPNAIAAPRDRIAWTIVARDSGFSAGALLLGIVSGRRTPRRDRMAAVAFYWIAAVSIFFGVEHFLHPQCVPAVPLEKVVPRWIPLAHFWTVLTGVLLLAGGGAMLVNRAARRVAAGLGAWVLLLVLSLYLAIMISQRDIEGLNYFADTMMFAGVLFIASLFSRGKSGSGAGVE